MVDRGVSSRGGRGELSEFNDFSTTLLDAGCELILHPAIVDEARGISSVDLGVPDIRVHRGRVVSPDGHLLDVGDLAASLQSQLSQGAVVVKTGHCREVLGGEVGGVVLANESVGVCGVANDDRLAVTSRVVVDRLTDIHKDLAVVLEEISTLHAWASGLGTNKEVVVDILEGDVEVARADDVVEERESAIVQLSLDTLEDLLLEGQVEQVEDDALVLAEELATEQKSSQLSVICQHLEKAGWKQKKLTRRFCRQLSKQSGQRHQK